MMAIFNRLLAFVLGAAMIAGGLLVALEAIWAWTGSGFVWIPGREWLSSFETTPWSKNLVVVISVAVGLVGLILLLSEVRPQRRRVARFATERGTWLLSRRSTEAHLSRRLEARVSVSPIKTRLNPRGGWRLKVHARAARSTRPTIEAAAMGELRRLHASGARVQVKTTGKAGAS
jgi:hypothetical protein